VNRINNAEKNGRKYLSELFFMNSSARVRTIFLPESLMIGQGGGRSKCAAGRGVLSLEWANDGQEAR